MKNKLRIFSLALLTLSIAACFAGHEERNNPLDPDGTKGDNVILSEGFTDGWKDRSEIINGSTLGTFDTKDDQGLALSLIGDGTAMTTQLKLDIDDGAWEYVSFRFLVPDDDNFNRGMNFSIESTAAMYLTTIQVKYDYTTSGEAINYSTMDYSTGSRGKWHKVELFLDYTTKEIHLYLDGIKKPDSTFTENAMRAIILSAGMMTSRPVLVDDVVVMKKKP